MEPLQVLVEESAGDPLGMPPQLAQLYGTDLRVRSDLLYANMICSLDGVVALAGPMEVLRGHCSSDRLVMGLLRAAAEAVVIGAGTLRASGRHRWTAEFIDPERKQLYAGWARHPVLAVVSASGELDPSLPAFQERALVLTTQAGAARLGSRLPEGCRVIALGSDRPTARQLLRALRAEGHQRILAEGGPTLLGHFLAEELLEELFLTISPSIAGRRRGDGRLGLVEGAHLLPGQGRWGRLWSLRRQGSCLYARYAFDAPSGQPGPSRIDRSSTASQAGGHRPALALASTSAALERPAPGSRTPPTPGGASGSFPDSHRLSRQRPRDRLEVPARHSLEPGGDRGVGSHRLRQARAGPGMVTQACEHWRASSIL